MDVKLQKAVDAFNKGDVDIAESRLRNVIAKNSKAPLAYFLLGKICVQKNELITSKEMFQKAVALDEANVQYLSSLSGVLETLKLPSEQLAVLRKLVILQPEVCEMTDNTDISSGSELVDDYQ